MPTVIVISLVILNLLFFPFWIRFCFGSFQGLLSSVYYGLKPDWLSFLDGSLQRDCDVSIQGTLFWSVTITLILVQLWVLSGSL